MSANGELTKDRLRVVISEALKRVEPKPLSRNSQRDYGPVSELPHRYHECR